MTTQRRTDMHALVYAGWIIAAIGPGLALAASPRDEDARFRVQATVTALARSAEGRYALSAEVRVVPQQTSVDGRYALKSASGVACGVGADALFANGFEN